MGSVMRIDDTGRPEGGAVNEASHRRAGPRLAVLWLQHDWIRLPAIRDTAWVHAQFGHS